MDLDLRIIITIRTRLKSFLYRRSCEKAPGRGMKPGDCESMAKSRDSIVSLPNQLNNGFDYHRVL